MPRKIPVRMTVEQLENVADRITKTSASIEALTVTMKLQKFEFLDVAHHHTLVKAMAGLESFVKAAWDANHERRQAEGDYGAPADGGTARKKKKGP